MQTMNQQTFNAWIPVRRLQDCPPKIKHTHINLINLINLINPSSNPLAKEHLLQGRVARLQRFCVGRLGFAQGGQGLTPQLLGTVQGNTCTLLVRLFGGKAATKMVWYPPAVDLCGWDTIWGDAVGTRHRKVYVFVVASLCVDVAGLHLRSQNAKSKSRKPETLYQLFAVVAAYALHGCHRYIHESP